MSATATQPKIVKINLMLGASGTEWSGFENDQEIKETMQEAKRQVREYCCPQPRADGSRPSRGFWSMSVTMSDGREYDVRP